MIIKFSNKPSLDILLIGVAEDFEVSKHVPIDNIKVVEKAIASRKFKGKMGDFVSIWTEENCTILVGLGKVNEFNQLAAIKIGSKIVAGLKCTKLEQASFMLEQRLIDHGAEIYAAIAHGIDLRNYSFDKYKSLEKLEGKTYLSKIEIVTEHFQEAENIYLKELKPVAESVNFSRNLISEPPNVIYPASFVEQVKKEFAHLPEIKIEVLGEKEMQALGMHSLLGVGQGSSKESKLLVLQYNGDVAGKAPLAFVGKGVTFDTGGISLKPANGMEDMKYDMSGAAIVVGLIRALAARDAKVNIVAIAGLVENMPDGNAQRPSDVVKSMSGQTIEVLNTDAEGRLVLADALWYCQDRFKPELMINLATLTGAIIVSLGTHHAGLFSNNIELEAKLIKSGKVTGEKLWPLPLGDEYDKMIDSTIADVRNTGNGKGAGSITAAQFLQRFVNKVNWAHLDIAGVSWADKDSAFCSAGATGFGVRLLNDFVKNYEQ